MNLGYCAGDHNGAVRRRVEVLFGAVHPMLGPMPPDGEPSAIECVQIGINDIRDFYRDSTKNNARQERGNLTFWEWLKRKPWNRPLGGPIRSDPDPDATSV